jgi:hypothetical protein
MFLRQEYDYSEIRERKKEECQKEAIDAFQSLVSRELSEDFAKAMVYAYIDGHSSAEKVIDELQLTQLQIYSLHHNNQAFDRVYDKWFERILGERFEECFD